MERILQNDAKQTVIHAVKNNLYAFFKHIHRISPLEVHPYPGLYAWQTAIPHPWFNAVLSTHHSLDETEAFIHELLQSFQRQGVNAISWWLAPELDPKGWEGILTHAHFLKDSNTPGMALKLENLQVQEEIPGFEIQLVEDLTALETWVHTFGRGYGLPEAWDMDLYHLIAALGLEPPFHNYLGLLEGEPVSASTMFLGAGVAGIYNVGTLETARGRGIGSLMTAVPLLDAHRKGYQWGVLQSSQMGFSVYQKLGFEKVCDMEHFYLQIKV